MKHVSIAAPLSAIIFIYLTNTSQASEAYISEFQHQCAVKEASVGECKCILNEFHALGRKLGKDVEGKIVDFLLDVTVNRGRAGFSIDMTGFRHPALKFMGPLAARALEEKISPIEDYCKTNAANHVFEPRTPAEAAAYLIYGLQDGLTLKNFMRRKVNTSIRYNRNSDNPLIYEYLVNDKVSYERDTFKITVGENPCIVSVERAFKFKMHEQQVGVGFETQTVFDLSNLKDIIVKIDNETGNSAILIGAKVKYRVIAPESEKLVKEYIVDNTDNGEPTALDEVNARREVERFRTKYCRR